MDRIWNISQGCKYLGVTRQTIYNWEKQGKIRFTKVNGRNFISEKEIKRLRGE